MGKAEPDPVLIGNYRRCIGKSINSLEKNLRKQREKLSRDYSNGKISRTEYERAVSEINNALDKLDKEYQLLANNYRTVWTQELSALSQEYPNAFNKLLAVKDNVGLITGGIRDLVEAFSEVTANAFVGEETLLYYGEAVVKFLLSLEIGIAFPLLLLLSMMPTTGTFPFRVNYLILGTGSYLMIRLIRVGVLLLFLIAHSYFLSRGF